MEPFELLSRIGPDLAVKFVVAVICGGAIGMERETTGKSAGLRTSIVISVGSMLFTVMSVRMGEFSNSDPTRIAAQIVTGIGFLGAGVILRRDGGVQGMTTAAMIWLMAALGMMIGAGYLLSAMAVTAATVVTILFLARVERWVHHRHARRYTYSVRDDPETRRSVIALVESYEEEVVDFSLHSPKDGEILVSFAYTGSNATRLQFLHALAVIPGTHRYQQVVAETPG